MFSTFGTHLDDFEPLRFAVGLSLGLVDFPIGLIVGFVSENDEIDVGHGVFLNLR
jgi:hypothetical protein